MNRLVFALLLVAGMILALSGVGGCPAVGSQPADALDAQRAIDGDRDGFPDERDPAPDDPTNPADLGSPEKILSHPLVTAAIDAVNAAGYTLDLQTAVDASFKLDGAWRWDGNAGVFLRTSSGSHAGAAIAAGTVTYAYVAPGLYREAFNQPQTSTGAIDAHGGITYIRGNADGFTVYSVGRVDGATAADYQCGAKIVSGRLDRATGDLVDLQNLYVIIAVSGAPRGGPAGDQPGGWLLARYSRMWAD
jgi:hypothetical protein